LHCVSNRRQSTPLLYCSYSRPSPSPLCDLKSLELLCCCNKSIYVSGQDFQFQCGEVKTFVLIQPFVLVIVVMVLNEGSENMRSPHDARVTVEALFDCFGRVAH